MMAKESKTDSVSDMEDRKTRIKEESDRADKEKADKEAQRKAKTAEREARMTEEEANSLEHQASLTKDIQTREQLLERVRQMREEKPEGPPPPPPPTEFMKEVIGIEQQAGRDAVAKAEKEMERVSAARRKADEETRAREGTMSTVQHQNPGQNEKFPTNNRANTLR
jgi:type II secretory pathway component HofQ